MTLKTEEINEVTIQDRRKEVQGFTTIKKSTVKKNTRCQSWSRKSIDDFCWG